MKRFKRIIAAMLLSVMIFVMPVATGSAEWLDGALELMSMFGFDSSMVEDAVVDLLSQDWFRQTPIQEKVEFIATFLEQLGVTDAETVRQAADQIFEIEYHGQKLGILLQDFSDDILTTFFGGLGDDPEAEIQQNARVNKKALIMYGLGFMEFERSLRDSQYAWSNHGLETTIDTFATVADFKSNLSGNDLVVVEIHGSFDDKSNIPYICLTEQATTAKDKEYKSDIDAGRIRKVITSDGVCYWLAPSFFSYYYNGGKLNGTTVWLGCCYGAKSDALVNALTSSGAKVATGYSESVYCYYDYKMLNTYVSSMINGESSGSAYQKAKNAWGENDYDFARQYMKLSETKAQEKETAYPKYYGTRDLWYR